MRTIRVTFLISFIFLTINIIEAQKKDDIKRDLKEADISRSSSRLIERGHKLFNNYAYDEAIDVYLKAIAKEAQSLDLYANLADSYYENADMENAVTWYSTLVDFDLPSVKGEYYFRYSQALKAIKDYSSSDLWLSKLAELNADDSRGASLKYDPKYLDKIEEQSNRYEIKPTSINTEHSEFAASYGDKGVIFSSDRFQASAVKRIHTWTGNAFLELFSAEVSPDNDLINEERIKGDFNSKYNESTIAVTNDGNTMYFTRNSFSKVEKGYQKDDKGVIRLKLYKATKVDGVWKDIVEFPYNDTNYSVAHPTLSQDNKKLYFASDMPGTEGLSDIYVVDINSDGGFSLPRNLGNQINTEGRDTFPFIAKDGHLYFSSDGHLGLGGLDVFVSLDPDNAINSKVYNVGKPINSERDDFAFIIDSDTKQGYFTSNRTGGAGGDDIYSLKETKSIVDCTTEITGVVINKESGSVISNARLTVFDSKGKLIKEIRSNANGEFSFESGCDIEGEYKIVGEKANFNGDTQSFEIGPNVGLTLRLEPIIEEGVDLFEVLSLKPIYFDYDKSFIRDDAEIELAKIITYMQKNPSIKIDVRSHTDSRGSDNYNLGLSNRRNVSTIDYIVSRGNISRSRITGRGYGETELKNRCGNGVKCIPEEHQLNRRSEFIVVKN